MLSLLKRRVFLIVLGFVLLAVFIWYGGPYFAFAEYRPLESETARLIAIALVVLVWVSVVSIRRLRASRTGDKLLAAVVTPSQAEERPSADVLQLRERFEHAIASLKQTRRRGHSLYELPWYVFIGAPGSGKTTALVNSGLSFPLQQRLGKEPLRGVGGTRNCEWLFAEEAVFLDTAGRYMTQDSDAAGDSAAWAEFLALLRKYRKRRPVNGVILTISAQDLIMQGEGAREAHVAAARRRLNELNRELRIQLPVYLMVTKCDLVAGFTEYFDDLAQEGRAQVWGVTWPIEQTLKGDVTQAFPAEFDALVERLNARVLGRLEDDRDVRRRTKVFAFPHQMVALRDALAQFVTEAFGSTRFDQQKILLRGVYFTSGTQEGTPIDRLLGAIGRRFAVAPEAVVSPGGRGKAYFIERLIKDVILPESGLAGVNRRVEVQKAAAQLGAYAAMALVAVLGVIVFSVSYSRNRAYVAQVDNDIISLKKTPPVATASLEMLLPRLDAVRTVNDSANRYEADTPWSMRWGLYQGASIGKSARDAYFRELDGALLVRVASRFEQRLVEYAPDPENLYQYLKVYLMLGEPQHLDKKQLATLADLEWKAAYVNDPETGAALSKHFRNLLETRDTLRPIALDPSLVAQARSTIRQASIPQLIYRRLKLVYADDAARVVRLDIKSGLGADRVFRRKSGASLSEPVSSIYTRAVFEEVTKQDTAELVSKFQADRWVWGETGMPANSSTKLAAEVTDIYEKDYIAVWDAILNDIAPVSFSSPERANDALATLAGPTSPLRGLLQTVDENTFLVKPPDPAARLGTLDSVKQKVFDGIGKILPDARAPQPGSQVTAHFEPIHRLLAGAPGSAPIDRTIAQLGALKQVVATIGTAPGMVPPSDPRTQAQVVAAANSIKEDARTLPPAVGAVTGQIAQGVEAAARAGAGNELAKAYGDVQRDCVAAFGGRYPFTSTSTDDVQIEDFGRLLGYNGVFDNFFKSQLGPYVDTARSPWTWRSGAPPGIPTAVVGQFEAAGRIRETFFRPGGQRPELHFSVTPLYLDAAATRFTLEIDGQPFDYRHGPERMQQANWPGPKPGEAAVTFEETAGRRSNKVQKGPWAWFRLIDAANIQRETDARHVLGFDIGGHQARVRIDAASIRNPFATRDVQQFRCGAGTS